VNKIKQSFTAPIWLMQPIPYFGEKLSKDWIYEPKIDGWRLQIIKYPDGKIECWGRRLEKKPNWTNNLSVIIKAAHDFPPGTIVDAELYSTRGRRFIPSVIAGNRKAKPLVYLFDIIYYRGKFIGNLPLKERKKLLNRIIVKPPLYIVESKPVTNIKKHLLEMANKKHEGIVLKKLSSLYILSTSAPIATEYWRKIRI
jgi:bifunctional non-homologous end joining protein LigD